ncbi:glycoprotein-N-acetylgalactosamine 3-beta-galactosyltransferase 1 [Stomoxys calcitrans]|uniref:Glycoprotein-N-acetylgalactosamine 3-beta-galactosyltransferase 1 n=1 Tax=Stomoxys calcitrans TaxID=35570 RepID=A0A1I8NYB3_STOCA|nr:glycoprotein-N-acetylgalactosamine 3-beta-galactosyltransferase 1 [Stomoxys calcitrans]
MNHNSSSSLKLFITLMIGIVIGFTFSQVMDTSRYEIPNLGTSLKNPDVWSNNPWQEEYAAFNFNDTNETINEWSANLSELNTKMADQLYDEVKVLCWILTGPANHEKKAIHVKNTWGSRCNKLLFMSSAEDSKLGSIKLPVGEGRGNLWNKTREAFKYIYDHYLDEYDWFLKADDDTYVIVENLRLFLYPMSTEAPVYFGCKFKPLVRQGYMSGGAGYVLSKEALKRFVELGYSNKTICHPGKGGSEDKEMGKCLQNVGVVAGDSRDDQHRGRFFPSGPNGHLKPKPKSNWYWRYIYYATEDGLNCCSDYAISFHYIHPDQMYVMDYLIYTLRPFGILPNSLQLPPKKDMNELLDKWRNETSNNPL